jgi:EAL domain-containing protein (putative c-di-GMP-specific phosphodiesterase class I)
MLAIRHLVEPADLSVVFQPIVRLGDHSLYAYEALVRCRVPELSRPQVLFERAVTARCAGRLGRMIREIAVPLGAGLPLFLNVHPAELQEGWLVRPDDPIFEHDHDLFLEISESVPLTHFELCRSVLSEVRSRGGVHLVIDDLGAGTSNLMRIADLEPSVVKLDRALIANMNGSRRQQQMIKSVVKLCSELSANVIAEGVETRDELSALLDTGAQFAQGYLFARPNYPLPIVSWPTAALGA